MRVLMITGDKKIQPGHPRFDVQAATVEELVPVFWGRGSLWPAVPQRQFDAVTVQDPFVRGLFAWFVARRLNTKFNVQVHTDLDAHPLWRHVLAQIVLRHADSVRVVSHKLKKQVERMKVRSKVSVLPVFIDPEVIEATPPADLKKEFPQFTHYVLVACRLEPERDVATAIVAMEQVLKSFPQAGLLIAGSGSERSGLEELAARLGIQKSVIFLGYRSDPYALYKSANVYLNTARHESWGASIVEALAAGCPVVSPDVGVAKEAGAIVVPRSDLAQAVVEVLKTGVRGELTMPLLNAREWSKRWHETLL